MRNDVWRLRAATNWPWLARMSSTAWARDIDASLPVMATCLPCSQSMLALHQPLERRSAQMSGRGSLHAVHLAVYPGLDPTPFFLAGNDRLGTRVFAQHDVELGAHGVVEAAADFADVVQFAVHLGREDQTAKVVRIILGGQETEDQAQNRFAAFDFDP